MILQLPHSAKFAALHEPQSSRQTQKQGAVKDSCTITRQICDLTCTLTACQLTGSRLLQDEEDFEADGNVQQGLEYVEKVMANGELHGSIIGSAAAAFGAIASLVRLWIFIRLWNLAPVDKAVQYIPRLSCFHGKALAIYEDRKDELHDFLAESLGESALMDLCETCEQG